MAVTIESVRFLAPGLEAIPDEDINQAIEIAAAYRPACLKPARQDDAQRFYVLWLLYSRRDSKMESENPIPFGIVSEKEGDLARTFGTSIGGAAQGYFDQWNRLHRMCGAGNITASDYRKFPYVAGIC